MTVDKLYLVENIRCVIIYSFVGTNGTHPTYYVILGNCPFIDILLDCTILFVECEAPIEADVKQSDEKTERFRIKDLSGRPLSKGTTIHFVLARTQYVYERFILEYVPWNVGSSPFKV